MEKLFHLKECRTTVRRETAAGITTFFAMAYIIFVNPVFLSAAGMDPAAVMIATSLAAPAQQSQNGNNVDEYRIIYKYTD